MIIGIDASRANHDKKTGVEWYAWHVIQELKKIIPEDIQVVLYTNESLKNELAKLPNNWTQKVLKWPPKRLWTQIRLSWEMFVSPPDVLFIPAHVFPIIHPKKTVMTVHDVAALKFPESYNWFEKWYSVFSARWAVNSLWKIITPSEFTKSEIKKFINNKEVEKKISVIHHGYSKKYKKIENKIEINRILDKYKIKKPFLITIGRLEEKKNTAKIVEAFEEYRMLNPPGESLSLRDSPSVECRIALLLIGKPGYGHKKVERVIKESKFKNDIIEPGWVDEEDMPYLMNAAETFVFPSLYEGFGIPVLESMACGTPVVASRGNSLEEVGGEVPEYVDSDSIKSIASGIEKILSNSDLKNKKITKGLERVKLFSWDKCARETFQVIAPES